MTADKEHLVGLIEQVGAYLAGHSLGREVKPESLLKTALRGQSFVVIAENGQKIVYDLPTFEAAKKKIIDRNMALEKARQELAVKAVEKAAHSTSSGQAHSTSSGQAAASASPRPAQPEKGSSLTSTPKSAPAKRTSRTKKATKDEN